MRRRSKRLAERGEEDPVAVALVEAQIKRDLRVAAAEGRLYPPLALELGMSTGSARCPVCGMLAWDARRAVACCTDPDVEKVQVVGRAGAAAVCVNPEELHKALEWIKIERGYPSFAQMAQAYGLNAMVFQRLRTGYTKWISAPRWSRMLLIFKGIPPGCVELSELTEGEAMEDEELQTDDSWVDDKLDELDDRRRYESEEVRHDDE